MPLLADYAITPDVFDVASYSTPGECEARLDSIRQVMVTEGLVRDLRGGEWRGVFDPDGRQWHRRGLELVRKLATQGRLVPYPPALPDPPLDDQGWCAEALATRDRGPFTGGVIVTKSVKDCYRHEQVVARVDRLPSAPWWASRSPSVRLTRTFAEYETHLDPILRCSNSLMFIDPHLDPEKPRYGGFGTLLQRAGRRTPAPLIEIHRVCQTVTTSSGSSTRRPDDMLCETASRFRRQDSGCRGRLQEAWVNGAGIIAIVELETRRRRRHGMDRPRQPGGVWRGPTGRSKPVDRRVNRYPMVSDRDLTGVGTPIAFRM